MTTLEIVEQGTILRATVGSTVHGLHHGGQDDRLSGHRTPRSRARDAAMPEPERSRVMAVRRGERSFEEVLAEIDAVERQLEGAPTDRASGRPRRRRRQRVPRRGLPPSLGLVT
jgi:hypothetical protein